MDLEQCKQALRAKGVKVENLSDATIKFLCEGPFGNVGPGPAPDINSIDPAERVKAGMQELDAHLADGETKSKVFDLISDAIEMLPG